MIYIADTSGQFNLWRQRSTLNKEEGEINAAHQMTTFVDDSVRQVFTSPKDSTIVFFADHHGSENFQIYTIDAFNGWPIPITHKSNVRYEPGAECFSHDGEYITYISNETNSSNMLVYVRKIRESQEVPFCVTNKPGWFVPGYWSSDSKKINCSQLVSLMDYRICLLDVEKRDISKVTPSDEEKSRYIVGPWSSDGQGFYIITDLKHGFAGLAFYDINRSKLEWILTPNHEIESVDISRNGKVLAWSENVDGYSKIYIMNLQSGEIQELSNVSSNKCVVGDLKISPDGNIIGFLISTSVSPSNIYVIDIATEKLERLTNSLLGNIPEQKMAYPELIKYKSFDGLEITAFLYKPIDNTNYTTHYDGAVDDKNKNKKFGAILSIHGRPTAQERPTYSYAGFYQYMVNKGLVVFAPNFRGSTGYGKSFEKEIYHDWGGNELKDLEHAIKWLLLQNWVDPNRIGVFGASFGGFATLSCITRLPQYNWKVAVDIVGPSNLITFAKSVPEHWKRLMGELVGDPEKEQDFLKARSPITYVDNMADTNLLVIQGANDPRVVKEESDQIVERLRKRSKDIEYIVFEDEGHGFTKSSNLIKALRKSSEFFVKILS